jgi:hypothetical protein
MFKKIREWRVERREHRVGIGFADYFRNIPIKKAA